MRLPAPVERATSKVASVTKPFRNLEIGLAIFCFFSPVLMILFDSCRYTQMDPACQVAPERYEQGIRAAISHYWDMPAAVAFYVPLTVAVMMFVVRAAIRHKYAYNWALAIGLLLLVVFNHEHFESFHYAGVFLFFITAVVVLMISFARKSLKLYVLGGAIAFFLGANLVDSNWAGNWALWAEWASLVVIAFHFVLIAWTSDDTYEDAPLVGRAEVARRRRPGKHRGAGETPA